MGRIRLGRWRRLAANCGQTTRDVRPNPNQSWTVNSLGVRFRVGGGGVSSERPSGKNLSAAYAKDVKAGGFTRGARQTVASAAERKQDVCNIWPHPLRMTSEQVFGPDRSGSLLCLKVLPPICAAHQTTDSFPLLIPPHLLLPVRHQHDGDLAWSRLPAVSAEFFQSCHDQNNLNPESGLENTSHPLRLVRFASFTHL